MTMSRTENKNSTSATVGMQEVLTELVRTALRDSADVLSIAIGDHQGLPIINATRGTVPVMAYTATATMSLRAARAAAEAVGMAPPEYVLVQCPTESLVILDCGSSGAALVAQLRANSNLGLCLVILRKLADRVSASIGE